VGLLFFCGAGRAAAQAESDPPLDGAGGEPDAAVDPDEVEVPEPPGARPRVAVLLLATGELDPTTADSLTEVLIGTVAARGGVTILGKEEFQAQLGQGDAGTLECISSTACMGRVGVQLGVTEIIAGTLARRDAQWVFNLNRVDVRTGEVLGRVFREIEGDLGGVADALGDAIPELYVPAERPSPRGVLVISAREGAEVSIDGVTVGATGPGALREDDVAPGQHEVRVRLAGFLPWSRTVVVRSGAELHLDVTLREEATESIHPLVWIGGGIAVAALAAAIAVGVSSSGSWEPTLAQRLSGEVTRAELLAYYDARTIEAIVADVLFGVAGAAGIAAVVAIFFPERRSAEPDDDDVDVLPTAGGIVVRGRF
jgi:hypothetical protein